VAEPPATTPSAEPGAGGMAHNGLRARPRSARSARPAQSAQPLRRLRPAVFQLVLLGCYLVVGVLVSWPRASYLAGRLPATADQSSYVWSFWWLAHQITHLGNPWFHRSQWVPRWGCSSASTP
jgi:hypothetical protein